VKRWQFPILVSFVSLIAGCTSRSHHGDAVFLDHPNFPMVALDEIELPPFSLGQAGTYRWYVRDLPTCAYPDAIVLRATDEEMRLGRAPWQQAEVKVTITDCDGKVLFAKDVPLGGWHGGGHTYSGHDWEVVISMVESRLTSTIEPRLTSYDVSVEVLVPSARTADSAHLEGLAE
jgi:hypothetical protein